MFQMSHKRQAQKPSQMTAQTAARGIPLVRNDAPKKLHGRTLVNYARQIGVPVETKLKAGAARNPQLPRPTPKRCNELDEENHTLKHETIGNYVGQLIMSMRQKMEMSQEKLAEKCRISKHKIQEYEAGRGLVNASEIAKIECHLGIHLQGKSVGKQITAPEYKTLLSQCKINPVAVKHDHLQLLLLKKIDATQKKKQQPQNKKK